TEPAASPFLKEGSREEKAAQHVSWRLRPFYAFYRGRVGANRRPMKTNAVVLIVSAGVGTALVGVGACSSMMGNKAKKVVIEDGRIFIPGTSVSQADQD